MTDLEAPDGLTNALRGVGRHLVGPADEHRWWVRADDGTRGLVTVVPGGTPGGSAEIRRRVDAISRVQHEHLAPLGPVLALPGDGAAVLQEQVEGHDLDTVRSARGAWSPGEVVTVLVPLAGAVAALHDVGLSHEVTARGVTLAPDGRAVLTDLVRPRGAPGPGGADDPPVATDDVAALGRLGLELLEPVAAGTPRGRRGSARPDPAARLGRLDRADRPVGPEDPGAMAQRTRVWQVLSLAARSPAQERPSAIGLASELYRACPPMPVEQPEPAVLAGLALRGTGGESAVRDRGRHRRRTAPVRRLIQVGAASLAVAVCGVTVAATVTGAATEDPVDAAVALTHARAEALVEGDLAALRQVTVPGSPAAFSDAAAAREAAAAGLVGGTLSTRIELAEELPRAGGPDVAAGPAGAEGGGCPECARVHLRSVVTAEPAQSAGATDRTEAGVPAAAAGTGGAAARARDVVLVLIPTDDGWRVSDVRPYDP